MTARLTITPAVIELFPEVQLRVTVARGLRNDQPWPDVEERLRGLEAELAASDWQPPAEDDPVVASWHQAYRKFGTNPRRFRPSIDALSRRLRKRGTLPRISPAVDAYNLISVTHGTPAGAFDLRDLDAEVLIRTAEPGDHFTPLGEPAESETPHDAEVVYAYGSQVLTRHWNHRDCEQTKVTASSRDVVFILERISGAAVPENLIERAQVALVELIAPHTGRVSSTRLDGESPTANLEL